MIKASGAVTIATSKTITTSNGNITIATSRFVNNSSSSALNAGGSNTNWSVWSSNSNPFSSTSSIADNPGNLSSDFIQYSASYGVGSILGSGNGYFYTLAPSIAVSLTGIIQKNYDGTANAYLNQSNYAITGAVNGDTVTITNTSASYTSNGTASQLAYAGTGKNISVSGVSISGASNGSQIVYGYRMTSSSTLSSALGAINKVSITYTGSVTNGIYNGNAQTSSQSYALSGVIGSDAASLSVTRGTGTNANTYQDSNASLTGSASGNYQLASSGNTYGSIVIAKAPLNLTISKFYDGSSSFDKADAYSIGGMLHGDSAPTIAGGSATTNNSNAATYTSFTTNSLVLSNGNYTLVGGTVSAVINRAVLSITINKAYDATSTFDKGDAYSFTGMAIGQSAPTIISGSATTSGVNAATYNSFATNSLVLSNSNYTLVGGAVSASIDKAYVTYTGSVTNGSYNGSAQTSNQSYVLSGVIGKEAVSLSVVRGSGTNANAYLDSNASLTGSASGNYQLASSGNTYGSIVIAKAALNIVISKFYDGSATFDNADSYTISNPISGAVPTIISGSATTGSANAATYTSFTTNNLVLSNSNYTLVGGTVGATIKQVSAIFQTNGNWSTNSNWSSGIAPISSNYVNFSSITINSTKTVIYDSGVGSLNIPIVNNGTINFAPSASTTYAIGSNISGFGSIIQSGSGTTVLSGANSYQGGTTISSGILSLGSASALGSVGNIVFSGGVLQYSSSNINDYSIRFSASSNQSYSVDTNSQNITWAGALTSSGGTLTKLGLGTLTLTNSSNTILELQQLMAAS
jgi:autotransporter-associated beta strand protein